MAALPVATIMFLTFMSGIQTDIQEFSDDVTVEMLLNPKENPSYCCSQPTVGKRWNLLNVSANDSSDISKLFLRCDYRHSAAMFLMQLFFP